MINSGHKAIFDKKGKFFPSHACYDLALQTAEPNNNHIPRMNLFFSHTVKARAWFVTMAIGAALVIAQLPVPAHAFLSHSSLTTAEEEDLGDEFVRNLKKRFTLIEDPSIAGYVDRVGQEIVRQHASPPFTFRFYIVKEDVYNAFAVPGGHVFIYSGLLAAMENEQELAGLLAHEVAHVFCRHISKRIEQSKKITLMTLAGVLTGVFLGNPELAGAITSSSIAAGQSLSLAYSREDERQADQVGLKYLEKAGYSGEGLLEVLRKIRGKRWFGSDHIPTYVTTHPAVEERMAYLDTWTQSRPKGGGGHGPKDSAEFHKVHTKLIALYGDPLVAHNAFDTRLKKNSKDPLGYYGMGLLATRERNEEEAVTNLHKALSLQPHDGDFLRDLGMNYLNMGNPSQAYKNLSGALDANPNDQEARFLLGRAQIETGDTEGALKTLKDVLDDNPEYLPVYYYLGEAHEKMGHQGEAHYLLGVYFKKKGNPKNARFHLSRARTLFPETSARQEAIQEELKSMENGETDEAKD